MTLYNTFTRDVIEDIENSKAILMLGRNADEFVYVVVQQLVSLRYARNSVYMDRFQPFSLRSAVGGVPAEVLRRLSVN